MALKALVRNREIAQLFRGQAGGESFFFFFFLISSLKQVNSESSLDVFLLSGDDDMVEMMEARSLIIFLPF